MRKQPKHTLAAPRSDTLRDVPAPELDVDVPKTVEMPPTTEVDVPAVSEESIELEVLLSHAKEHPLDAEAFRDLAQFYRRVGDKPRAEWMKGLALAVASKAGVSPEVPRLILSANHRKRLKHSLLQGPEAEVITLASLPLCRLYPARGNEAGSGTELSASAGPGASGAAQALSAAVRILGMKPPSVFLSMENGPPFSLTFYDAPRLLVGKLAVKRELSPSELRFYAGRALFSLNRGLMPLRLLRRESLAAGLQAIGRVLKNESVPTVDGRAIRDALPAEARGRLNELLVQLGRRINIDALLDGARHSTNRAGLMVCGSLASALHALKAKKALKAELEELVRFAMSEDYFMLTSQRV